MNQKLLQRRTNMRIQSKGSKAFRRSLQFMNKEFKMQKNDPRFLRISSSNRDSYDPELRSEFGVVSTRELIAEFKEHYPNSLVSGLVNAWPKNMGDAVAFTLGVCQAGCQEITQRRLQHDQEREHLNVEMRRRICWAKEEKARRKEKEIEEKKRKPESKTRIRQRRAAGRKIRKQETQEKLKQVQGMYASYKLPNKGKIFFRKSF